jgi:hypothetical protein
VAGLGPMYHWTDQKISIHAFHCMLGVTLLRQVRRQAEAAWPGLSTEELLEQLRQIRKYTLLNPPQGAKRPNRVTTVLSKQSLTQQRLAQELGLGQLGSTPRRKYRSGNTSHVKRITYTCPCRLRSKLPLEASLIEALAAREQR